MTEVVHRTDKFTLKVYKSLESYNSPQIQGLETHNKDTSELMSQRHPPLQLLKNANSWRLHTQYFHFNYAPSVMGEAWGMRTRLLMDANAIYEVLPTLPLNDAPGDMGKPAAQEIMKGAAVP